MAKTSGRGAKSVKFFYMLAATKDLAQREATTTFWRVSTIASQWMKIIPQRMSEVNFLAKYPSMLAGDVVASAKVSVMPASTLDNARQEVLTITTAVWIILCR
jgi:hypothetical protein